MKIFIVVEYNLFCLVLAGFTDQFINEKTSI